MYSMKDKQNYIEKAYELRQKYAQIREQGKEPNPKLKALVPIYGEERLKSVKGCVAILYHLYRTNTYTPDDFIFHMVDQKLHVNLRKAVESREFAKEKKKLKRLKRKYENLLVTLAPINDEYYLAKLSEVNKGAHGSIKRKRLEDQIGEEDLDDMSPSRSELAKIAKRKKK